MAMVSDRILSADCPDFDKRKFYFEEAGILEMKRIAVVLFGGLLTVVGGCSEPAPTPDSTTTPSTESATGTETKPAETPAEGTAPADHAPPAEGSTEKPAETTPSETPASAEGATPAAETKPEETTLVDPILKGLEFPGLDKAFAARRDAYNANPTDAAAATEYIGIIAQVGMIHSQNGSKELSLEACTRAGEMLEKALAANVEIEQSLKPFVYYNHACVKSANGKADEALGLLEKAIDTGFNDIQELKTNKDLAAVRELSGFAEKVEGWEAKAREVMLASAKTDLAAGESFAFGFELTDTTGAPIKLTDYQGKVCIVDIWGTWCPPCRAEIPSFVKLQETYGEKGFQIIGLNQESGDTDEEKIEKIKTFMTENGMNYPCALITEDVMGQVPDFQGFPTTLFIDRSGKVRMKAVGLHEYEYLESIVQALLAEEASASAPPATDAAPAAAPAEAAPADAAPAAAAPAGDAAPAAEAPADAPKPVE